MGEAARKEAVSLLAALIRAAEAQPQTDTAHAPLSGRQPLLSDGRKHRTAALAEEHGASFGRIEFIDRVDGELRRLDLQDPKLRKRARILEGADQLRQRLLDSS